MTQIQILTDFVKLLEDTKQSLEKFNNNFQNEIFEKHPAESNEEAYERGEQMFQTLIGNMNNLKEIVDKQSEINKLFKKCKNNQQILKKQKNKLINKLSKIKKESVEKDEWKRWKNEWDEKREETKDERNRRECKEMLVEMTEKE